MRCVGACVGISAGAQWWRLAQLVGTSLGATPTAAQMARLLQKDNWAPGQKPEAVRVISVAGAAAPVKVKTIGALLDNRDVRSGFLVVARVAGVDQLRELASNGRLVLEGLEASSKLALEQDTCTEPPLTSRDALAAAFQISRQDGGMLVLSARPDVPQAYFSVASNIEVPMKIEQLATGAGWPGQAALRTLLESSQTCGAVAHIAWAYSSKFNQEDDVYIYIRAESPGSWTAASPPPLARLGAAEVQAIGAGWLKARAADGGQLFGGEYGPTTFDVKAAINAGYDAEFEFSHARHSRRI